ncbi:hypothetical protein P0Y35_00730 [Kiritimatiellaeota bacterium B1221]|nr:hypothetical protein [Kiritimatiellaeota bacterium B1221]
MKKSISILFFIISLCGFSEETESTTMTRNQIRAFLNETQSLYASEDPKALAEAATRFQALLEQSPEGELSSDALRLAQGMAQIKAGEPEKALQTFSEIEGFEDPLVRGQLRQMKGNAHLKMAQSAMGQMEWKEAKEGMKKAVDAFTNTLRENPEMDAARNNLEFAQKCIREIEEQEPPPSQDPQKQDQEKEDEEKDNQDQQKQNPENQQDPSEKSEPSDPQEQSDPSDQQEQSDPSDPSEESDQEQEQAQDQESDPSEPEDPSEQQDPANASSQNQAGEPNEMSDAEKLDAIQAQQILDAALEQEKAQRRLILQGRAESIPVEKDW